MLVAQSELKKHEYATNATGATQNYRTNGRGKHWNHSHTSHHFLHVQLYGMQNILLVRTLPMLFIFLLMWNVQKPNQLQTLPDSALQSQTDQDVEHKYYDKVCWFACVCAPYAALLCIRMLIGMYVYLFVFVCIMLRNSLVIFNPTWM